MIKKYLNSGILPGATLKENMLFLLLIAVGIVVRLIYLGDIPGGLNQDEASIGYDAFALLEHGIDRNGFHNPVHLIAWGSGQNALYAYLSMPFIKLFGLSVFSVRIVNALLGVISLFLFYAIARRLVGKEFALYALFLLVICPWHIMMNRWGLESNLFPGIVLVAFYFLLKAFEDSRFVIPSFFFMSLSLYAYGTAYVFVPVFVIGTLVYAYIHGKIEYRSWGIGLGLFVVTAIPIGMFLIVNLLKLDSIETPLFSVPRYPGVARFSTTAAFFSEDFFKTTWENFQELISLLLVKGHDGLLHNGIPEFGYLYPFSLPFSVGGLLLLVRDFLRAKTFTPVFFVLAWLISAILVALSVIPNVNRINIVFFPLILSAAYALYQIHRSVRPLAVGITLVFSFFFILFVVAYFGEYNRQIKPKFFASFNEAIKHAEKSSLESDPIHVTSRINQPYIAVLFHLEYDPGEYIRTVKIQDKEAEFQQVTRFGRYKFGVDLEDIMKGAVFVVSNREAFRFPEQRFIVKRFEGYSAVYSRKSYRKNEDGRVTPLDFSGKNGQE